MIALTAGALALTGLSWLTTPALADPPVANPKAPVSWEVPDIGRVVLVEDHRAPLVEVRLHFPAGAWSPWFRESGGEEAFNMQIYDPEGSLRARVDALAADMDLGSDDFGATLTFSCLKEDLADGLELIQDVIYNRDYDPSELKRAKKGRTVAWEGQIKDPSFRLEQAGRELLFAAGDPRLDGYEEPTPMVTDVAKLSDVRNTLVRLPGRTVGFAGDLNRAEIDELVVGLLPPVEAGPDNLAPTFSPLNTDRPPLTQVPMPTLTQVYFALGRESLPWTHEDYAAMLVASHVLGGHFYSRLYLSLRHDGGETYGAGARFAGGPEPGPYGLTTFTRVENAERTEEKLRAVLDTFHADGITQEELDAAVGNLMGERAFSQQAPGQVLDDWLWESARGLPAGWRESMAERAGAMDLEAVNAFITDFYDPAKFVMVRVEPEVK